MAKGLCGSDGRGAERIGDGARRRGVRLMQASPRRGRTPAAGGKGGSPRPAARPWHQGHSQRLWRNPPTLLRRENDLPGSTGARNSGDFGTTTGMRPRPRRLFVPRYIALRSRDPSNFPESLTTYVGDVTQRLQFDVAGLMVACPGASPAVSSTLHLRRLSARRPQRWRVGGELTVDCRRALGMLRTAKRTWLRWGRVGPVRTQSKPRKSRRCRHGF